MKTIFRHIPGIATVALLMGGMASCTSEAPFAEDGMGHVRLDVSVNTKLTRSQENPVLPDNYQELLDSCRIYISNDKGLLHQWKGCGNIPADLYMRYGDYTAEAWTGQYEYASFDAKFFKGEKKFSVGSDAAQNQVDIYCQIANVVASIDNSTVDSQYITDLSVEIGNTKGSLTFTGEDILKKGYYMMPEGDASLYYKISATNVLTGAQVKVENTIEDVEAAHEYRLKFLYDPNESQDGGAFIKIQIEEENLIDDVVVIKGKPAFSWVDDDPKVDAQIQGTKGNFVHKTLRVAAYSGFASLKLTAGNAAVANSIGANEVELIGITEAGSTMLEGKGISATPIDPKEDLYKYFIEFGSDWLNGLPESSVEYVLTVTAVDKNGKQSSTLVRVANTESAYQFEDPVIIDTEAMANDFMAVGAKSATLKLNLTTDEVENPAIQYRAEGESAWNTVALNTTRAAGEVSVTLTNLMPGTTYEYRAVAGSQTEGKYEFESEVYKLTTETTFTIPNASMEDWGEYQASTMLGTKTVIFPGLTRDSAHEQHFWDSGNEGGATANKILTNKSTDMVHSGTYSARLASDAALGIIAAGNLFTGYYVKTDGTNGVLSLGHRYDGSHPAKLRVYVNYRPATGVTVKKGEENNVEVTAGGLDHGRILVALSDGAVDVRTNPSDRKLLSPDDDQIVAYGEVSWQDNFSPDGQLTMVEIPFEYNDRAKTLKPTHLVIVCAASKFGDYFTGAKGSVMYVDDFELVYE